MFPENLIFKQSNLIAKKNSACAITYIIVKNSNARNISFNRNLYSPATYYVAITLNR